MLTNQIRSPILHFWYLKNKNKKKTVVNLSVLPLKLCLLKAKKFEGAVKGVCPLSSASCTEVTFCITFQTLFRDFITTAIGNIRTFELWIALLAKVIATLSFLSCRISKRKREKATLFFLDFQRESHHNIIKICTGDCLLCFYFFFLLLLLPPSCVSFFPSKTL